MHLTAHLIEVHNAAKNSSICSLQFVCDRHSQTIGHTTSTVATLSQSSAANTELLQSLYQNVSV